MNLVSNNDVKKLCDYFDKCKRETEKNKVVVERFLANVKSTYSKTDDFFIKNSIFIGIGSSYEDTVSDPRADFDIAMVLPIPFTMSYFKCTMNEPGLYILQNLYRHEKISMSNFLARGNFLNIELLRKKIFAELSSALQNVVFEKYKVSFKFTRLSSSFCVKLEHSKYFIKIDIVPQIKATCNGIPGWKGEALPKVIKDYIIRNDTHILFNLSSPPNFRNDYFKPLIVQPSFNLLEKVGMLNSDTVRYSVCITKAVYKHYRWSKKGLRSFHIKRVALLLYDQINHYSDPWKGYWFIMKKMITMLENGKIDGCFIANQNIICVDKTKCLQLATEIREVLDSTNLHIILGFTGGTLKSYNTDTLTSSASQAQIESFYVTPFIKNEALKWFELLEHQFSMHSVSFGQWFRYAYKYLPQEQRALIPPTIQIDGNYNDLKRFIVSWDGVGSRSVSNKPSAFTNENWLTTRYGDNTLTRSPSYRVSPSSRSPEFNSSNDSSKWFDQMFGRLNISNENQPTRVNENPFNRTSFSSISSTRSPEFRSSIPALRSPEYGSSRYAFGSSRHSTVPEDSNIFSRAINGIVSFFNNILNNN